LKLKELRATGTKFNLLNYIIDFCQTKYPEVLEFRKELSSVIQASKVNLSGAKTDLAELKKRNCFSWFRS